MVGQPRGTPRRTLKEVVIAIQTVSAGVIVRSLGLGRMGHAPQRMFAQAHDPTEQTLTGRLEGGTSKGAGQTIDKGIQRAYHMPHGGTSHSLRSHLHPQSLGGTPCFFTIARLS